MTNIGYNLSFMQLLENHSRIVIPIIQRDYAQGRVAAGNKKPEKKDKLKDEFMSLCEEVRNGFVDSIKSALINDKKLVLDYIYGSKENDMFSPIDGQQRLTTLFLLYWYVAAKENKLTDDVKFQLQKFTYETRDTSLEFCRELVLNIKPNIALIPKYKLSEHIRNYHGYYSTYESDPTVQSMLVMLDALHDAFYDTNVSLWDRLQNITFWVLDLENFGLTDDLFVKMNARGKRLSRFDVFKSDLEAALKNSAKESGKSDVDGIAKTWITEIDNTYLDSFWNCYKKEYAERNMFRLCMFLTHCFYLIDSPKKEGEAKKEYDESWEKNDKEMSYKEQIEQIAHDEALLAILCSAMDTFDEWRSKDDCIDLLLLNPNATDKANEWEYHSKARVFGKIYWFARLDKHDVRKDADFDCFERILRNYLHSHREYNIKIGRFTSRIDKKIIPQNLSFIKKIIDDFAFQPLGFREFILKSAYDELEFEREKLRFAKFEDILALEQKKYLGRNIQNIFFHGIVHIPPIELDEIVKDKELCNLSLRIIFSNAKRQYGSNSEFAFDSVTAQTRSKLVFCGGEKKKAFRHMIYIAEESSGWGNKVLSAYTDTTAQISDLSDAVKQFAKDYYAATGKTVREKLETVLASKIKQLTFTDKDSIIDYLVKYPEFYQDDGIRVLLKREWDGVSDYLPEAYNLYCVNDSLDTSGDYYQPFYKAIESKLNTLTAVGYKREQGVMNISADYELSNGWLMQILSIGNFKIHFNGKIPPKNMIDKYGVTNGEYTLEINPGEDCIEKVSSFLNEA